MKIALFITCINDLAFPETPKAVVEVLERLGHEITFPKEQTCCGQMHLNTGYRKDGLALAERFMRVFSPFDAIVSPSASCVGTIRELYGTTARSLSRSSQAQDFDALASRVFEFSEFLVDVLGVTDVGASFPHSVTYHPTCHSLRVLHLNDKPRVLLQNVKGLRLVELEEATTCCGFGGTFALKNAEVSTAMGADKVANLRRSGAEVFCSVDNSCLTHLGGLASRLQLGIRPMHLAQILASTDGRHQ